MLTLSRLRNADAKTACQRLQFFSAHRSNYRITRTLLRNEKAHMGRFQTELVFLYISKLFCPYKSFKPFMYVMLQCHSFLKALHICRVLLPDCPYS